MIVVKLEPSIAQTGLGKWCMLSKSSLLLSKEVFLLQKEFDLFVDKKVRFGCKNLEKHSWLEMLHFLKRLAQATLHNVLLFQKVQNY